MTQGKERDQIKNISAVGLSCFCSSCPRGLVFANAPVLCQSYEGKALHPGDNQTLSKCIAAHPVLFILTLETTNSRGVSDAFVAVRHICPKSALLSLYLCPLAAPQESVNCRQKAQQYTSIPLMLLAIENSERRLCRKHSKIILRVPLQPYLNCLLQFKVPFFLLPCCAGESPLTLHYLVSQEWAL